MTASGGVAQWESQEVDIESILNQADKGFEQPKEVTWIGLKLLPFHYSNFSPTGVSGVTFRG
ncbi:hypothetical protein [Paraglaciecola sp. MB-3u-78]|jgi:hypothetical protein|uniref:hypothetical protein n=1 Tax=Paraglaciecola sp. MB-3u-78 TaxID=2058332 RepID=UPI000C344288|nr:hypothetical protein [Paraglaciecola sp. MB-3u-78]PKG98193.1 hypothetical protein CXF95_17600 [Paraglaciecola sp. MB-3u-78]